VSVSSGQSVQESGDTTTAPSDDGAPNTGECAGANGSTGIAYEVTPTDSGKLTVTMTPSSTFDAVLYVVPDACVGTSIAQCSDKGGAGATETVSFAVVANQKYVIFADGHAPSQGTFTLRLDLSSGPTCGDGIVEQGEDCDSSLGCDTNCHVTLDPTGADVCPGCPVATWSSPVTISGSTQPYLNSTQGTCYGATSPERMYQVTPHSTGTMSVTITQSAFDSVLYVRTVCASAAASDELTCIEHDTTTTTTFAVTDSTPVFLYVDGFGGGMGTFTVTLTPP
jgi:hypothetical protein